MQRTSTEQVLQSSISSSSIYFACMSVECKLWMIIPIKWSARRSLFPFRKYSPSFPRIQVGTRHYFLKSKRCSKHTGMFHIHSCLVGQKKKKKKSSVVFQCSHNDFHTRGGVWALSREAPWSQEIRSMSPVLKASSHLTRFIQTS